MDVSYDKDSLKVGEALTLSIVMSGNGRPKYMPDPILPDFSEFRVVPPESKITTRTRSRKIVTKRTLKYFLYPRRPLDQEFPGVELKYFDPKTESYQTIKSDTKRVVVTASEQVDTKPVALSSNGLVAAGNVAYQNLVVKNPSVTGYLKDYSPQDLYKKTWYWLLWLLLLTIVPLVRYGFGYNEKRRADVAGIRKSKSSKALKKKMLVVKDAVLKNNKNSVYTLLEQAMNGYLSDLFNVEFNGMTRKKSEEFLKEKGASESWVLEYQNLLNQFDSHRFGGGSSDVNADIEAVEELLQKVEGLK